MTLEATRFITQNDNIGTKKRQRKGFTGAGTLLLSQTGPTLK